MLLRGPPAEYSYFSKDTFNLKMSITSFNLIFFSKSAWLCVCVCVGGGGGGGAFVTGSPMRAAPHAWALLSMES